ncbi:MAG: hypothetical protein HYT97_06105 [Elusimicrobia bacterium]|nr:hypothetical protein [Elusimicrobiota bacterium]
MFALRIPEPMKKEMSKIPLNWSDYLRSSISEALESQKKRNLFKKLHNLAQNSPNSKKGTAARIIRQIRDRG